MYVQTTWTPILTRGQRALLLTGASPSHSTYLIFSIRFNGHVCIFVYMPKMRMEVREQLAEVGSFLAPYGSWDSNSGHQECRQAPFIASTFTLWIISVAVHLFLKHFETLMAVEKGQWYGEKSRKRYNLKEAERTFSGKMNLSLHFLRMNQLCS